MIISLYILSPNSLGVGQTVTDIDVLDYTGAGEHFAISDVAAATAASYQPRLHGR